MTSIHDVSQSEYTPFYSEENVYLLCKKLIEDGSAKESDLFVVFISNESKHIPMWHQKDSDRPDGMARLDYHVFCVQVKNETESEYLVWDLDSTLEVPLDLSSYVSKSIRHETYELFAEFERICRVVHAPLFLRHFSSDRSHMEDSDSSPPNYNAIVAEDGTEHNLNLYTDMLNKDVMKVINENSSRAVFTQQFGVLVHGSELESFFSLISQ